MKAITREDIPLDHTTLYSSAQRVEFLKEVVKVAEKTASKEEGVDAVPIDEKLIATIEKQAGGGEVKWHKNEVQRLLYDVHVTNLKGEIITDNDAHHKYGKLGCPRSEDAEAKYLTAWNAGKEADTLLNELRALFMECLDVNPVFAEAYLHVQDETPLITKALTAHRAAVKVLEKAKEDYKTVRLGELRTWKKESLEKGAR
ncbi:hypothetical protein ACFL6C_05805 [Myxococcota bacterium]